jgi:TP901 family phage tail tape measure protein
MDTAMINLSRYSDANDEALQNYANSTYKLIDEIGGRASELVDSTSEFAKLGYSFEEAAKLGEAATKYATAGDISIDEATNSLSGAYTVFKDELLAQGEDISHITDLYNEIGNNLSITSGDVGVAMTKSANALSMAGNSIEEAVALIATAQRTVQNAETVGKLHCQVV